MHYDDNSVQFLEDLFNWPQQGLSKSHYDGKQISFYKQNSVTIQKKRTIFSSSMAIQMYCKSIFTQEAWYLRRKYTGLFFYNLT